MATPMWARVGLGFICAVVGGCPPTSRTSAGPVGSEGASDAEAAPVAEAEPATVAPDPVDLDGIRARGELRILLFGGASSILPRSGDPTLQDEAMAVAFARHLGLAPLVLRVEQQSDLVPALLEGRGDIIAAQLSVTPDRVDQVAFSRGRISVDEVLVASSPSTGEPASLEELDGLDVHVRPSSSYAETLADLERESEIDINVIDADPSKTTIELLLDVAEGRIPRTVADDNILAAVQEFESGVEGGLVLAEGRELAWAVRPDAPKLRSAVDRYVLERALTQHSRKTYTADLDQIVERGVLRVLTRNNAISYFLYRGEQFGFEYELLKLLAEELDVRLQMVVVPSRDQLIPWLLEGRGDVIAAGLTDTEARTARVRFSRPYLFATQQLVRKADADGPRSLGDLAGRTVHVRASSAFHPDLVRLKEAGLDFEIVQVDEDVETEELIDQVARGDIELTVADSHVLDVEEAYGEGVVAAFEIPADAPATRAALAALEVTETEAGTVDDAGSPEPDEDRGPVEIAFATRPDDEALADRLDAFIEARYRQLRYNILRKRYFENPRRFRRGRYAATGKTGQISPYDGLIRKYARKYQFDWRLMAAQAYVESRFDPNATSWVGAKGLFQVMPRTGRSLGFTDLEDPAVGTHAGIKYMSRMVQRFEGSIPLEQRVHFALAAYNAGLGHVHDARRLARQLGLDPDVWFDNVERAMLKLSEPKYARQARHGYCRGRQPVAYVRHIQEKYEAYVKVAD